MRATLDSASEGMVEMTLPDKPRSSKQRYRLTAGVGNGYSF
jgi:hypothetical protein